MSLLVVHKLLAIFMAVGLGWLAGRLRWLGEVDGSTDPARLLGKLAFTVFVPALLFRTTARLDLARMPWSTVLAYFAPAMAMLVLVYVAGRLARRGRRTAVGAADLAADGATNLAADPAADPAAGEAAAAAPAVRSITAVFGNSVQVGIPLVAALYGEAGLGIHIALTSVHALLLLTTLTLLVELDLARERAVHAAGAGIWRTLRGTVRNMVIHPVVMPVLLGLACNLAGLALPGAVDETLKLLGSAVAPLCLVLIGISLATTRVRGSVRAALGLSALKLLALPALVLGVAHGGFGLVGLPLQVAVLMAAMPIGTNALLFAQRYRAREAETTTAIVLSTLGFALTAPLWLAVVAALA